VIMRIKLACPAVRHEDENRPFSVKAWENIFNRRRKIVHPDTELVVDVQSWENKGVHSFESFYDLELGEAFAAASLCEEEKEGFDAIAIDCAADQGLYGAKELLGIPVVGAMESAMHIACLLGRRFSVITIHEGLKRIIERQVILYQMQDRCASVRDVGIRVENIERELDRLGKRLTEMAKRAVEEDDADVIIIGGTALSAVSVNDRVGEALKPLGVPVLCGGEIALKLAEMFVQLNIAQSKRAFPPPPEKERFL
jgi:allantoin racemase